MKYLNARDVFPPNLLSELQKYIGGEIIYIPKKDNEKAGWGQISGTRSQVISRNMRIVEAYERGSSICELMNLYCLSEASIRKIVYSRKTVAI